MRFMLETEDSEGRAKENIGKVIGDDASEVIKANTLEFFIIQWPISKSGEPRTKIHFAFGISNLDRISRAWSTPLMHKLVL